MVIENIITNVKDMENKLEDYHIEKVYLESSDLLKRIQRVTTDHNREIGIRLKDNQELHVGDVLYQDDDNLIVIDVLPEELLVILPRSLKEMGDIAHQLGNRHLPAQFEEDSMIVQYDYLVEELLSSQGIPFTRKKRKVGQAFRHVGHSHG
ncbi:urease accessory protein UreE [Thalassobacillus devorans]|uniref:urease accessory protein UreE n=1 Tax=Thalassobacillus devorans TaxID=279813 RepID=UPI0004908925|nr:urease accessory protein UreE [Thalassobacillus devorans]